MGSHIVTCTIGYSSPVSALIDSGSDWNVVSEPDWKLIDGEWRAGEVMLYEVKESPRETARAFASELPLQATRSFHAWVQVPDSNKPRNFAKFYVIRNGDRTILGRDTAVRMELLAIGVGVRRTKRRRWSSRQSRTLCWTSTSTQR